MSAKTTIGWTDSTYNPLRARFKDDAGEVLAGWHCEHVSEGCRNCYAERMNKRLGTGFGYTRQVRDRVETVIDEKALTLPLHWKKPRKVFVCSMTDLFAEFVTDEQIDRVFAVMALCPQHTFQVLTKRPERMREYFGSLPDQIDNESLIGNELELVERWGSAAGCLLDGPWVHGPGKRFRQRIEDFISLAHGFMPGEDDMLAEDAIPFPLPNVWLMVSVENQETADRRIKELLATPAAVRGVSYEPALESVDFLYPKTLFPKGAPMCCDGRDCGCKGQPVDPPLVADVGVGIDWIIVGGESGPKARPFDIQWARQTIRDSKFGGYKVFVKQIGKHPVMGETFYPLDLDKSHGADPAEWPTDLRVQQFPEWQKGRVAG